MRALDGNPQTHWVADATETQSLTIDMGRDYPIGGLTYLPHPDGGRIESYEVHISRDGQTWRLIHRGTFGNIVNDPSLRTELFEARYTARFVKLANLRPPSSETRIGAAEIEILAAK
jgi:alpha-L-fucosidase